MQGQPLATSTANPHLPRRSRAFDYPDPALQGYADRQPFPHAVLRNHWEPALLDACKRDAAAFAAWDGEKDFFGSKKKRYCGDIERLPSSIVRVIEEASSPTFLHWLMDLTGEPALLPDPYLEGGGIHQIAAGGFLKVHADFNWNEKLQLYRRLNLLLYLNRDWDTAWGGALELWKQDMSQCAATVAPEFNTMVLFTTDDKSFHGHPQALTCPATVTRDSIALYYYSPIRPSTNFKECRIGTDYRPIGADTFEYYDPSLRGRIKNRLKKLLAR
jgi:Rps23 Pro-64 3,4-dihydroxylase Tpa1-like proline 4-hydroxylase